MSVRGHGDTATGIPLTRLLVVEGIDDLAEADVDLVQSVAAGGIVQEAMLDGGADFSVCVTQLLLR